MSLFEHGLNLVLRLFFLPPLVQTGTFKWQGTKFWQRLQHYNISTKSISIYGVG